MKVKGFLAASRSEGLSLLLHIIQPEEEEGRRGNIGRSMLSGWNPQSSLASRLVGVGRDADGEKREKNFKIKKKIQRSIS